MLLLLLLLLLLSDNCWIWRLAVLCAMIIESINKGNIITSSSLADCGLSDLPCKQQPGCPGLGLPPLTDWLSSDKNILLLFRKIEWMKMWSAYYTPTVFVRFRFLQTIIMVWSSYDSEISTGWWYEIFSGSNTKFQSHRPCQSLKRRKMKFDFTFFWQLSLRVSQYWGQGCDHPVWVWLTLHISSPPDCLTDWLCWWSQMLAGSHPSGNWRDEIHWESWDRSERERGPTVRLVHITHCQCSVLLLSSAPVPVQGLPGTTWYHNINFSPWMNSSSFVWNLPKFLYGDVCWDCLRVCWCPRVTVRRSGPHSTLSSDCVDWTGGAPQHCVRRGGSETYHVRPELSVLVFWSSLMA